jgi:hypothetical protein
VEDVPLPPQALDVVISPAEPQDEDDLILTYTYTDTNGDPEGDTLIRWTRDGQLQTALNQQSLVPASLTFPGETWCAAVRPHDGSQYGAWVEDCVTVVPDNYPPQALNVVITPTAPTEFDDLVLSYDYTDSDGDPEGNTQLRWYRNDALQSSLNNQTIVPSSNTYPGDAWYAVVMPHDGTDYGAIVDSNQVIITWGDNHLPQALTPLITPADPESGDNLKVNYVYADPDDDPEGDTQLRWYRNGVLQPFYNDQNTVSAVHTLPGDEWYARIRPHDGTGYGLWAETAPVLVHDPTANTPPTATNLHISPAEPGDDSNLRLFYTYQDADGDPEANTLILWYKIEDQELVLQEEFAGLTVVPASATSIGETWLARVSPHDGQDYGFVASAQAVIILIEIGNHPPEARNVFLAPGQPCLTDTLELHYDYYDADGDLEWTTQIEWTKNGQSEGGFTDQTVIPPDATALDDVWCAAVRPFDYREPGPTVASNCVVVTEFCGNTPPQVKEVYISPARPRSDQALELRYTYFDADADPEANSQIRWYKDGVLQAQFNDLTFTASEETAPGQQWSASIRPHDGKESGVLTRAMTVTVNTPPVIQDVTIQPSQPQDFEALVLNYNYHDLDGDPLDILQISWYCNGSHQASYDYHSILPAGATSPGEQWFATAAAHDGLEYSPVVTSNAVTITESAVTVYSIYLPIITHRFSTAGDSYCEENDTQEQACPLEFNQTFMFYPDDVEDWYYVYLEYTASLHVLVSDYLPDEPDRQGILLVYQDCPTCNPPRQLLGSDNRRQTTMQVPHELEPDALQDLPPGFYYIRIYNPSNTSNAQPYYINITFEP